jgi:hypothetical protein
VTLVNVGVIVRLAARPLAFLTSCVETGLLIRTAAETYGVVVIGVREPLNRHRSSSFTMIRVHKYTRRRRKEPPLARAIYDPITSKVIDIKGKKSDVVARKTGIDFGKLTQSKGRRLAIPVRAIREAAASTLDDLLEFGVVPPTYLREYERPLTGGDEVASLQTHVDGHPLEDFDHVEDINNNDFIKIVILDFILGNTDRHDENILVDKDGRAFAIDNEAILGSYGDGNYGGIKNTALQSLRDRRIPLSVQKKLKDLEYADFITAMAGAADKESIDAAWDRKQITETWKSIPSNEDFEELWVDYVGETDNEGLSDGSEDEENGET